MGTKARFSMHENRAAPATLSAYMMSAETSHQMATAFDPRPVETKWSQIWLDEKLGQPAAPKANERPFVVTIPPPNVTGVLHLGHALQHAIHDCLARYHRMKGEPTLIVPGTDHAGIATQVKVQNLLLEEGTSREALGPRSLRRARLRLEKPIWRHYHRADEGAGLFLRLGARALHYGRRLCQGGFDGL